MTSAMANDTPLPSLYLRIEYGETPATVLSVGTRATEADIREVYRAIALKIHPDKASNEKLRILHTDIFQKVQTAYQAILEERFGQSDETGSSSSTIETPKQLPETWASLHARNVDAREALQGERAQALNAKRSVDQSKAAQKIKDARITAAREGRVSAYEQEQERLRRDKKIGKEHRAKQTHRPNPAQSSESSPFEDKSTNPAQDIWDKEWDSRLVPQAHISDRRNNTLLGGGTYGSVSLADKKQHDNNAAAESLREFLALSAQNQPMLILGQSANRPFSGSDALKHDEELEEAVLALDVRAGAREEDTFKMLSGEEELGQYVIKDYEEG